MVKVLFYLAIITVSFDIFLTAEIGGLTFRISQLLLLIPFASCFYKIYVNKKFLLPIGFKWLYLWSCLMTVFVLQTEHVLITIGYCMWLWFSVIMIFCGKNLFTDLRAIRNVFVVYNASFFIVALFGILQFFLGIQGINILVAQWWVPGILPRVNGFSYEPSYYATYLLIGWSVSYYLVRGKVSEGRNLSLIYLFTESVAMFLSSSRTGIMIILMILSVDFLYHVIKKVLGELERKTFSLLGMIALSALVVASYFVFLQVDYVLDDPPFWLQGTGISGTAAHSREDRARGLSETLAVFYDSPIIGVSLGGVAERVQGNRTEVGKYNTGASVCVGAEVLAASGIVGIIPFLMYFFTLIRAGLSSKNIYFQALFFALIVEWVILQTNQNILRPYFWQHLTIVSIMHTLDGMKGVGWAGRRGEK